MPVYNGMPYLIEAVDSILSQTLQDFLFLIINDGSTDGSAIYLSNLTDKRVQVVTQPKRGLGAVLNVGLELCSTEFIARMDADDIALSTMLETQLGFLLEHPHVGLVGTQIKYFTGSGRSGFSPPLALNHGRIYSNLLSGRHGICHPSIMFRTVLAKKVGGYRTDGVGEDLDFFLRVGEVAELHNLRDVLHCYRLHSNSINSRKLGEVKEQYAYATGCAVRRQLHESEITFDEFHAVYQKRPWLIRLAEAMEVYASIQYRMALIDILNAKLARGITRLIYSSLCSPKMTFQRIGRTFKRSTESNQPKMTGLRG